MTELGVYAASTSGEAELVHAYQDSDYTLGDIAEFFQLGQLGETPDDAIALVLTAKEIRQLKTMADAYSFDHDEGFISMCLDLHRWAIATPADIYRFTANF